MRFPRWPRPRQAPPAAAPVYRGPAGRRLYAVGDIHGRADLLDLVIDAVESDAADARRLGLLPTVVFLGDYVDRGPDSKGVLARLIALEPGGIEWHFLEGNHEAAMVGFIEAPHQFEGWLDYGGGATLESYGIPADLALAEASARLRAALPADHRAFLDGLEASQSYGDYFFVHAGIRPGVDLSAQAMQDLLFIREPFLSSPLRHPKRVVHGHSIAALPQILPSRIGIDTGAYASGRLTCLMIEEERVALLTTRPDGTGVDRLDVPGPP